MQYFPSRVFVCPRTHEHWLYILNSRRSSSHDCGVWRNGGGRFPSTSDRKTPISRAHLCSWCCAMTHNAVRDVTLILALQVSFDMLYFMALQALSFDQNGGPGRLATLGITYERAPQICCYCTLDFILEVILIANTVFYKQVSCTGHLRLSPWIRTLNVPV